MDFFKCSLCTIFYEDETELLKHMENSFECKENTPSIECVYCSKHIPGVSNYIIHTTNCLLENEIERISTPEVSSYENSSSDMLFLSGELVDEIPNNQMGIWNSEDWIPETPETPPPPQITSNIIWNSQDDLSDDLVLLQAYRQNESLINNIYKNSI